MTARRSRPLAAAALLTVALAAAAGVGAVRADDAVRMSQVTADIDDGVVPAAAPADTGVPIEPRLSAAARGTESAAAAARVALPQAAADEAAAVARAAQVVVADPVWRLPAYGPAEVGADDHTVVDTQLGGRLRAVDPAIGKVRWERTVDSAEFGGAPLVDGARVFVNSANGGGTYAFSTGTGELLWWGGAAYATTSTPILDAGVVYVAADQLYAYDADTGVIRYTVPIGVGTTSATPAVADGVVYVGASQQVLALEAAGGKTRWSLTLPESAEVWAGPTVTREAVVVGTSRGALLALDPATGTLRWSTQLTADPSAAVNTRITDAPSALYASSTDGQVHRVDSASGKIVWSVQIGAFRSAPVLAGGLLWAATALSTEGGGALTALDPETGVVRVRTLAGQQGAHAPAPAGGQLYQRTTLELLAISLPPPT